MVAGPWLACLPGSVVDDPGDRLGINLDPRADAVPVPADRFAVVAGAGGHDLPGDRRPASTRSPTRPCSSRSAPPRPARCPRPQHWLGFLPDGPDLAPGRDPRRRAARPGRRPRRTRSGTLFRQQPDTGAEQFLVLRRDGLAPLSRTEFLLADGRRR